MTTGGRSPVHMSPRNTVPARPAAFASAVGSLIRELRVRRGWSRADLSLRTGGRITPSSISGYESGYRALKLELLALLCTALGVRVEAVIRAADDRTRDGLPGGAGGWDTTEPPALAR